jgi:hypothetical protein
MLAVPVRAWALNHPGALQLIRVVSNGRSKFGGCSATSGVVACGGGRAYAGIVAADSLGVNNGVSGMGAVGAARVSAPQYLMDCGRLGWQLWLCQHRNTGITLI